MNIGQNKFCLSLSNVVMGALLIIFVLWLNPVFFCLLLVSALTNFFLRLRLYRIRRQSKIAQ